MSNRGIGKRELEAPIMLALRFCKLDDLKVLRSSILCKNIWPELDVIITERLEFKALCKSREELHKKALKEALS